MWERYEGKDNINNDFQVHQGKAINPKSSSEIKMRGDNLWGKLGGKNIGNVERFSWLREMSPTSSHKHKKL